MYLFDMAYPWYDFILLVNEKGRVIFSTRFSRIYSFFFFQDGNFFIVTVSIFSSNNGSLGIRWLCSISTANWYKCDCIKYGVDKSDKRHFHKFEI